MSAPRRIPPQAPSRRGWCPSLARPMPTGDGLLARVHPPGGRLTAEQARAVAKAARTYGNGGVDVTARANLQIRGVTEATQACLAASLEEAGLGDTRHDGGPQRLTLTNTLAGLDPEGLIDAAALADGIEAAGRAIAGLPPKVLVAIEAGGRFGLDGVEADLILRASRAGHLHLALAGEHAPLWLGEVAETEAAELVAALMRAFATTGRRRIRDLTQDERMSAAAAAGSTRWADTNPPSAAPMLRPGLFTWAKDSLRRGGLERGSPLPGGEGKGEGRAVSGESTPLTPTLSPWEREPGAVPRTADDRDGFGLVAVSVEAPFGRCSARALDRLADANDALGSEKIRVTPARGFLLLAQDAVSAQAAQAALALEGFIVSPDDPRRAVAACTGAPGCASGSTPTLADAARLAEAFRPFSVRGLRAHVSGCMKGCAHPGSADLTLVGERGRYGIVLRGRPDGAPAMRLTFEAALERVRRADPYRPLDQAFRTQP